MNKRYLFVLPESGVVELELDDKFYIYKKGSPVNLNGREYTVVKTDHSKPLISTIILEKRDESFELKFDIRHTNVKDEFNSYGNSFGMAEVTAKAVQEIQEWIHAQENK